MSSVIDGSFVPKVLEWQSPKSTKLALYEFDSLTWVLSFQQVELIEVTWNISKRTSSEILSALGISTSLDAYIIITH